MCVQKISDVARETYCQLNQMNNTPSSGLTINFRPHPRHLPEVSSFG